MAEAAVAVLIAAASAVLLLVLFRGAAWLFGELSGWRKLELPFACNVDSRVWTRAGETIRVNSVRFRRCASAGIGADALYLKVSSIFRLRPIRIPWDRMSAFQPDRLYGRPAMRFVAYTATVAVGEGIYGEMLPHLDALRASPNKAQHS
ncbi:MAG: hypothetical protein KIT09_14285 [Bryobacteraceae bacterium]|nr:hypothetical protein [Bryobacteraceae bacterium]